jgi:cell division transport system permease protein
MRWLEEVFLNFKRSSYISLISIGSIIITIAMLGGYYIINESINYFTGRIEKKVEVVVFLKDDVPADKVQNMMADMQSFGSVAETRFVSKESAYSDFSKDEQMKAILDSFSSNPLPDSIVVRLSKYTEKNVNEVINYLNSKEGVEEVQYGAGEIKTLINILNVIKLIAAAAGFILLFSSLLVVSAVINLTIYARRQDIYVFRMVGASESFVRMPFILEGIVHGLAGGLLGWGVLYIVSQILIFEIKKETGIDLSKFYLFTPYHFSFEFLLMTVGTGVGLGFLGSLLSQGRIGK